jgi:DNA-binding transcriptional MerR regulator
LAGKRYRIGEFARLGAVPIKTLRYYDQLGLLRPAGIDARTRYRSYDATQLRDLAAIRALQDVGATLADIRRVINGADDGLERRRLLARLRAAALHTLDATRRSLRWLELELDDAERARPPTPVTLKQCGEVRIASIRASLRCYADIAPLEQELTGSVPADRAGDLRGVLWHRCEASGAIDGEPFVELRGRAPRGIELNSLPGARVASAYCDSDDAAAVHTYGAIERWIHHHSLQLSGPKREIYRGSILEIQFPVDRSV